MNIIFYIYIYRDKNVKISRMLINNDIWLTKNFITELFGVERSTK